MTYDPRPRGQLGVVVVVVVVLWLSLATPQPLLG